MSRSSTLEDDVAYFLKLLGTADSLVLKVFHLPGFLYEYRL
jgi:hypothetical protein